MAPQLPHLCSLSSCVLLSIIGGTAKACLDCSEGLFLEICRALDTVFPLYQLQLEKGGGWGRNLYACGRGRWAALLPVVLAGWLNWDGLHWPVCPFLCRCHCCWNMSISCYILLFRCGLGTSTSCRGWWIGKHQKQRGKKAWLLCIGITSCSWAVGEGGVVLKHN